MKELADLLTGLLVKIIEIGIQIRIGAGKRPRLPYIFPHLRRAGCHDIVHNLFLSLACRIKSLPGASFYFKTGRRILRSGSMQIITITAAVPIWTRFPGIEATGVNTL